MITLLSYKFYFLKNSDFRILHELFVEMDLQFNDASGNL